MSHHQHCQYCQNFQHRQHCRQNCSYYIVSMFSIFHLAKKIAIIVTIFYEWFSDETLASCWSSSANYWNNRQGRAVWSFKVCSRSYFILTTGNPFSRCDHHQGRAVWSFKVYSWSCFILTPGSTFSQYLHIRLLRLLSRACSDPEVRGEGLLHEAPLVKIPLVQVSKFLPLDSIKSPPWCLLLLVNKNIQHLLNCCSLF